VSAERSGPTSAASEPVKPHAPELLAAKAREELHDEFGAIHPGETIDRLFDESYRAFAGADVPDYVATLAQRTARDRLRALGQMEGNVPRTVLEIVFVGLEGRGRSQMAAALATLRGGDRVHSVAAATHAHAALDDNVVAAMAEVGADLRDAYAKPLSPEVVQAADVVVTLGRSVGDVTVPPDVRLEDWRVGDPVGASLDEVRRIRRELERRVDELLLRLGVA
jgi:protein-tyrosine-phosphatase